MKKQVANVKVGRACFLDRDGVINVDHGHVGSIERFEFIDGVFEACRIIQDRGYRIFVVTNQAGIAKGYYSLSEFYHLTRWVEKKFLENDVLIEETFFCPDHPEFTGECDCRKPKPGMLNNAAVKYSLCLSKSLMVGDKRSDLDAAISAGVGKFAAISNNGSFDTSRSFDIVCGSFSSLSELPCSLFATQPC